MTNSGPETMSNLAGDLSFFLSFYTPSQLARPYFA